MRPRTGQLRPTLLQELRPSLPIRGPLALAACHCSPHCFMTVSASAAATIPKANITANTNRVAMRMREPPAGMYNARLSFGRRVVSPPGLVSSVAAGVFLAMALSTPGRAELPDISAQRLLASWKEDDPGMRMIAEVIASAFASGMSWAGTIEGHPVYCPPSTAPLVGKQLMGILNVSSPRIPTRPTKHMDSRSPPA